MRIEIKNPREDQYGNSKKNIFLAFDDEDSFLGSAYTYPTINTHQTYETPYLIMINVNCADHLEKSLSDTVKQLLFDYVFLRAKELRMQKPELKTRLYSGFKNNHDELSFYLKNGFEPDYSIIMEAIIPKSFSSISFPENVTLGELTVHSKQEYNQYKAMYDEIFVTPLDINAFREQMGEKHYKSMSLKIDDKLAGGCTIFESSGKGYIETLFILPEQRGRGLSKIILAYIFNYFLSIGLKRVQLEVWQLNKRAVKLYQSFGFHEVNKNMMFPGITL